MRVTYTAEPARTSFESARLKAKAPDNILGEASKIAVGDAEDQRRYEATVFPLAVSALNPLVTMIIVSATGRGLRAEGVTGWIYAGLSIMMLGYISAAAGRPHRIATTLLLVLLTLALAVILDLDRPRDGAIQVSQQPLIDLKASLGPIATGTAK